MSDIRIDVRFLGKDYVLANYFKNTELDLVSRIIKERKNAQSGSCIFVSYKPNIGDVDLTINFEDNDDCMVIVSGDEDNIADIVREMFLY